MLYDKETIEKIGSRLIAGKKTIAVAESVTSGHLQAALSIAPNASSFYQGGLTAYNIGQKCRHLLVEPTHALEYNCVSEKVSADMALNVCRLFSSNYGIGITGYASTQPEIGINDLYAYICIVSEGKVVLAQRTTSPVLDSFAVQIGYTNTVLQKFFELVRS